LLPDARARAAVDIAEKVADGIMPIAELKRAEAHVREPLDALEARWRASRGAERTFLLPTHEALALALVILWPEAQKAAYYAFSNAYLALAALKNRGAASYGSKFLQSCADEKGSQANVLRCIVGSVSFRRVTAAPACLTPRVVSLAQTIYDNRAFDRLPEVADALEGAGCTNDNVLDHCRQPEEHVRGCWVVDQILGKE
jgi:hypothetical protein